MTNPERVAGLMKAALEEEFPGHEVVFDLYMPHRLAMRLMVTLRRREGGILRNCALTVPLLQWQDYWVGSYVEQFRRMWQAVEEGVTQ